MAARLVVVLAVVALVGASAWVRTAHGARRRPQVGSLPPVPRSFRGPSRTWLVFTTRYCAECGPVEQQLRDAVGGERVVRVEVERRPDLAARYEVRRAPTVVVAGGDGAVEAVLVGRREVAGYLDAARA